MASNIVKSILGETEDRFSRAREWWKSASEEERKDVSSDYWNLDFDQLPLSFRTDVRDRADGIVRES